MSWDETTGIPFYVNVKLVAQKAPTGPFDAALDQFGPDSRLIGPSGVESSYNHDRGGDMDELRIYNRALSDDNVAALSKAESPTSLPALPGGSDSGRMEHEWDLHYGWNRPGSVPEPLTSATTSVRKVEIHHVYDLNRWWWKATDGVPETTWPGVYNRSRLTGRNDCFQLPDWDCYSLSGKTVTFFMPDEPWNHIEMTGGAFGTMSLVHYDKEKSTEVDAPFFERVKGQEKTFDNALKPISGGKLRFANVEQETPISELSAYYVHPGVVPSGVAQLRYKVADVSTADNASLKELTTFIADRYPVGQRTTMVALPVQDLSGPYYDRTRGPLRSSSRRRCREGRRAHAHSPRSHPVRLSRRTGIARTRYPGLGKYPRWARWNRD